MKKIIKITLRRVPVRDEYEIEKIVGAVDIEFIPTAFSSRRTKLSFVAGSMMSTREAKELSDTKGYEVTTLAPK